MVVCTQLTKVFRTARGEVRALDGVDLTVRAGEFLCVRGPSGCGKTTLLQTVGAMLRPTAGRVCVAGHEIHALSAPQRAQFRADHIGFVFQMFHLVPYLTILENVVAAAHRGTTAENRSRAQELLAQLGLEARQHHVPADLSAGERQRAALARALLNQPKLILADEPTGNLDPANAAEVFRHLKDFQRGGGTVIVVTHGATGEAVADRVVEMAAGRMVVAGDSASRG